MVATARGEAEDKDAPPRPFLKWVGGKRQLLPALLRHVPSRFGAYHEPFVGGGALFFELGPRLAHLSDVNERLVRTYRGVRNGASKLIKRLASYPHDREFFLRLRAESIDAAADVEVAAWFIYLNRTGYNGLYRVNSKNRFNVPFGSYARPTICDAPRLRACSRALEGAELRHESFEGVLTRARRGDFVYFDPPYIPLSVSSSFTSYTSEGFGMEEQRRLRDVAVELKKRGVKVLLSNSSAPAVIELYERHFTLEKVDATRMINCQGAGRGRIKELVIHS